MLLFNYVDNLPVVFVPSAPEIIQIHKYIYNKINDKVGLGCIQCFVVIVADKVYINLDIIY